MKVLKTLAILDFLNDEIRISVMWCCEARPDYYFVLANSHTSESVTGFEVDSCGSE